MTKQNTDEQLDRSLGVFHTSFGAATATNNTLRILLLVFAGIVTTEGLVIAHLGNNIANQRPTIIRVDQLGRATPTGYESDLKPQANEVRYFITQFVNDFYSRNHDPRLPIHYSHSYAFFTKELRRTQFANDQQTKWLVKYLQGSDPEVKITVDNILVRNLETSPYEVTARLTFQFIGSSGAPIRPDTHHDVTIHFDFAQEVPNEVVQINPLGLIISSIHDDQVFTNN